MRETSHSIGVKTDDGVSHIPGPGSDSEIAVALLTGGSDRPYTFGLATALISRGAAIDLIASDELESPDFRGQPNVNFLNLRGDQRPDASLTRKVFRVLMYYLKLVCYAAISKRRVFHVLWNNKFELIDRTLLTLYYVSLGKKIVLTVHNVNAGKRDSKDTLLNRLTLRIQYRLADHIFVHTEKMKVELMNDFGVLSSRISVIPFGINNAVPNTSLSTREARQRLGIREGEKTILFFGNITPYKGLEILVTAFQRASAQHQDYRLIIAGRPFNCESYWGPIRDAIRNDVHNGRILLRTHYIPDDETEAYFKAADVVVLPYRHVYQSGVLFLGYSFGLPVLAADVGSLKDEIVQGETGFVFEPDNPADLARAIERYFNSDLYANLSTRRHKIRHFATERHSWDVVGQRTMNVYSDLLRSTSAHNSSKRKPSKTSLDLKVPD